MNKNQELITTKILPISEAQLPLKDIIKPIDIKFFKAIISVLIHGGEIEYKGKTYSADPHPEIISLRREAVALIEKSINSKIENMADFESTGELKKEMQAVSKNITASIDQVREFFHLAKSHIIKEQKGLSSNIDKEIDRLSNARSAWKTAFERAKAEIKRKAAEKAEKERQELMKRKAKWEEKGNLVKAQELEMQAETVTYESPPVATTNWIYEAEVFNMPKFIEAIVAGKIKIDFNSISIAKSELNAIARQLKEGIYHDLGLKVSERQRG